MNGQLALLIVVLLSEKCIRANSHTASRRKIHFGNSLTQKYFKNFQKAIDKRDRVCYNNGALRETGCEKNSVSIDTAHMQRWLSWSKAHDWKSCVRLITDREFESLPLR